MLLNDLIVIANVNNGGHFVLMTGYNTNLTQWYAILHCATNYVGTLMIQDMTKIIISTMTLLVTECL